MGERGGQVAGDSPPPTPRLSLSFLSCFSGAGAEQSAQGGEGGGHEGDKSGLNDQKQNERSLLPPVGMF